MAALPTDQLGMKKRIYLDYAATTPMLPQVWHAMQDIHDKAYGNPSSIHAEGRLSRTVIEEARKVVAHHIGASLGEVFFTSCGTECNNMIIRSCVRDLGVRTILTSPIEHPSVLETCHYVREQYGVEVTLLPLTAFGLVDMQALEDALSRNSDKKVLVSLMHVNNEIGCMHDLNAVGQLCRTYGALFHSDTVQSVGFHHFNMEALPVDFIVGSSHKFYGPKGVGFVFIKSGTGLRPLLFGGSQERNMRSGTENILGIHGLAQAIQLADDNLESRMDHVSHLFTTMKASLQHTMPEITFNGGPEGAQSPKILSVNFPPGPRTDMLLLHLDIEGISASGGSACSSGAETPSPVLKYLPIVREGRTVRFSFASMTTGEELLHVTEVLHRLLYST